MASRQREVSDGGPAQVHRAADDGRFIADDAVELFAQFLTTAATASRPQQDTPGIQTGGRNADGSPDTRGVTEKLAEAVTGDRTDDKTGKRV